MPPFLKILRTIGSLTLSVSTFNDNSPTSWFHKSVGGYHGAKLERYQELIDSSLFRELMIFSEAFDKQPATAEEILPVFSRTSALNMLNTKYVIYNNEAPPSEPSCDNVS